MKFQKKLVHGKLIRRYQRFLADVELDNGQKVIAHCTNSGSMKTCLQEGADVYMTPVDDPNRKTRFTWEMIKIRGSWVGINTNVPNRLAYEALQNGGINRLKGYDRVQREVTYGDSRFDLYLENDHEKCFVEVKNVTMRSGKYGLFPDAVTKRGKKHLMSLMRVKREGMRAVMLYVVQRTDVEIFGPAWDIDPDYSKTLKEAYEEGVEILPIQAKVTPARIEFLRELPYELVKKV